MEHSYSAAEYFVNGYNCAQAVAMAFSDVTGLTPEASARMASGFGGGFGRMREVCGAVSGMVLVLSQLYGYDTPNQKQQMQLYAQVQALMGKFQEQAGSYICRELLDKPATDPAPSPRTAEYYAKRPCTRMVMLAASLLDTHIAEHPIH